MDQVVAALIQNGFTQEELGTVSLDHIKRILQDGYVRGDGLIGFGESWSAPAGCNHSVLTTSYSPVAGARRR